MKTYKALYDYKGPRISEADFKAINIKEAKSFAQFHKRMTPEINKYNLNKVKTTIYVV